MTSNDLSNRFDTHNQALADAETDVAIATSTPWGDFTLLTLGTLWVLLVCCTPAVDFDLWWHLKAGELIIRQGKVPYHDWFTYTDIDRPWIDLHWGFQILVASLNRLGGLKLIVFCKALILTSAVAVGWNTSGRNLPIWGKTAIWLMPIIVISSRSIERPEILSLLFLAIWIWVINGLDQNPKRIWVLPVVQIIWVNCHALSVLGLAVSHFLRGRQLETRTYLRWPAASSSVKIVKMC